MQLAGAYEEIRAVGCDLWAIAPQPVAVNAALVERRMLPFPVLADADLYVIREWGLFNADDPKGRSIPYPAVYLQAPGGRVAWAHVSLGTRDRPTVGEILSRVRDITGIP